MADRDALAHLAIAHVAPLPAPPAPRTPAAYAASEPGGFEKAPCAGVWVARPLPVEGDDEVVNVRPHAQQQRQMQPAACDALRAYAGPRDLRARLHATRREARERAAERGGGHLARGESAHHGAVRLVG